MKKPAKNRAKCGTVSGYRQHQRHGEESCEKCRHAAAEYMKARRAGQPTKPVTTKKRGRPKKDNNESTTPKPEKKNAPHRKSKREYDPLQDGYLRDSGKKLWREIKSAYELDPVGDIILMEACRMKDRLDRLAGALSSSSSLWFELGDPIETADGEGEIQVVVNNMIAEARQLQAAMTINLGKIGVLKPAKAISESSSIMDQLQAKRAARREAAKKKATMS